MGYFTNEPPENTDSIIQRLKLYVSKSYSKSDKKNIQTLIEGCSLSIVKTGEWGNRYGYAKAIAILSVTSEKYDLVTDLLKENLAKLIDTLLQTTSHGLQITEVDFVPADSNDADVEKELGEILIQNEHLSHHLTLPSDLIEKGKRMSEVYLYVYFVENCLRLFIERVQKDHTLTFPREVIETINRNKENEEQNKFLPLRGNSDLFYCDFVQLQQIIVHNWVLFKAYFPQKDQHWLRVK